jgi:hypothetical protein
MMKASSKAGDPIVVMLLEKVLANRLNNSRTIPEMSPALLAPSHLRQETRLAHRCSRATRKNLGELSY